MAFGLGKSAEYSQSEMQLFVDVICNYEKNLTITDEAEKEKAMTDYILRECFDYGKLYCTENPDKVADAFNDTFGKKVFKKSELVPSNITSVMKLADYGETIIDFAHQISICYDGYLDYKIAVQTGNNQAARDAMKTMMDSNLYVCNMIVQKVPVIGPTLSAIVYDLNMCFDVAYNIIDAHLNQLEYTDIMCDYYTGAISTKQAVEKLGQLKYMDKDELEKLKALADMEEKFTPSQRSAVYSEYGYSSKAATWESKGESTYNSLSDKDKENYNGRWKDNTAGKTKDDAASETGDSTKAYNRDPLIINFDKSRKYARFSSVDEGVHFDLDNNGIAEKTAWIDDKAGFLVLDRDGSGTIDNGGELFGDKVKMKDGSDSGSGFAALREFDLNKDNVIDAKDDVFGNLRIWIDKNHNGDSEEDELFELSDEKINIKSISLESTETDYSDDESGTVISESSVVTFNDGSVGEIGEHWFRVTTYDTVDKNDFGEGVVISSVDAFGNIASLNNAIFSDSTGALREMVEEFHASDDYVEKRVLIKRILYFVTKSYDIDIKSRGGNIDARDLNVIESFMGQEFVGVNGPSPNAPAAAILKNVYSKLENMYFNLLNAESKDGEYLDKIKLIWDNTGRHLDLSEFVESVNELRESGENVDNILMLAASWLHSYDAAYNQTSLKELTASFPAYSADFGKIDSLSIIVGGNRDDELDGTRDADIIYAGAGDDCINAGAGNDTVYGVEGDDVINGEDGDDTLYGDDGNDSINGGTGNDELYGGDGDDTYYFNKAHGNDVIYDSEGHNTLVFGDEISADEYSVGIGIDGVITLTNNETEETIELPDFIDSPDAYDFAFDGETKMLGGGESRQVIEGTDGDDTITAGDGFNIIRGGDGDDTITGGDNLNFIYGGVGDDTITSGNGINIIRGDGGNDTITDGTGNAYIDGGDGNDIIHAGAGSDVVIGGTGDDEIYGEDGDDVIAGNNGDDTIYGGNGNDTIYADAGDDTVSGGNGNDSIFGGDGDDTLRGDVGDDYLEAGDGTDYLYGGAGSDVLVGGEGVNYMYGEDGDDVFHGGNGMNYIYGGTGNDTITGGELGDRIYGGTGNDTINGGNGGNRMYGEEGNDTIYGGNDGDYIEGGEGDDALYGGNGVNIIFGNDGDDIIYDGDDGSYIDGGDGNDSLYGGGGDDVLDGGAGNDYLQGDHGDDTYVFGEGYDMDVINASSDNNTIHIKGYTTDDMKLSRNGHNDLIIKFSDTDQLTIDHFFDYNSNREINFLFEAENRRVYTQDELTEGRTVAFEAVVDNNDSNWMGMYVNDNIEYHGLGGADGIGAGNGNDILDGGSGNDTLMGGNGVDTYIFAKGYDHDSINEWNSEKSIVKFFDITSDEVEFVNNGGNLDIVVKGTEDVLTINGYQWNQGKYELQFADLITGTVDKSTFEFTATVESIARKEAAFAVAQEAFENGEEFVLDDTDWVNTAYMALDEGLECFDDESKIFDRRSIFMPQEELTGTVEKAYVGQIPVREVTTIASDADSLTDKQVLLLTEDMSAFTSESQVSNGININDITSDTSALDQLLVNSSMQ